MGFLKTITTIDRRIIYALVLVLIAIPYLYPLALPITIPAYAQNVYDVIDALPNDAVVYYYGNTVGAQWGETKDLQIAVMQHLFSKGPGLRIMFQCITDAQGTLNALAAVENIAADASLNPYGYEYGTDFVGLYTMPPEEATLYAFFTDLTNIVPTDIYGTDLTTLPVMQGIEDYTDIAIILGNEAGSRIESWVRVATYYDMDMMFIGPSMSMPDALRWVGAGYVGVIGGMAGAAQYQKMLGRPGLALIDMDCMSTTHVFMVVLLVVSNLDIIAEKLGMRKVEAE